MKLRSPRLVLAAFVALLARGAAGAAGLLHHPAQPHRPLRHGRARLVLLTGGRPDQLRPGAFVGLAPTPTALLTTSAELPGWLGLAGGSPCSPCWWARCSPAWSPPRSAS